MGVFYMFKNFVSVFVTLHKAAVIWWGKDYNEIEEYVVSEPYTPEPTRKEVESRIGETWLMMIWIVLLFLNIKIE